jgi:hypothetical protein
MCFRILIKRVRNYFIEKLFFKTVHKLNCRHNILKNYNFEKIEILKYMGIHMRVNGKKNYLTMLNIKSFFF